MRLTGQLIKLFRVHKGLTQVEFAYQINISQAMLSYLENDVCKLTDEVESRVRETFAINEKVITVLLEAQRATYSDERNEGNYDI